LVNIPSKLSLRRRCILLEINRSKYYYKSVSIPDTNLDKLIFNIWNAHNNKGWRSICEDLLKYHNLVVNHKKVKRIMKRLGIHGILPRKNTSKANQAHYKYPYCLKHMVINQANMVWSTDITYIKLPQGHVYLSAIIDNYSRKILDYELSNTLDAEFCIRSLERAVSKYGKPKVVNSDQGVQYTSNKWISTLNNNDILISMDGKGRWADNVWIERLWRTIKYECTYLYGVENLSELKTILRKYIVYYNNERLHSSLGYHTPNDYYTSSINLHGNYEKFVYCEYLGSRIRVVA
jgi:putative transposase